MNAGDALVCTEVDQARQFRHIGPLGYEVDLQDRSERSSLFSEGPGLTNPLEPGSERHTTECAQRGVFDSIHREHQSIEARCHECFDQSRGELGTPCDHPNGATGLLRSLEEREQEFCFGWISVATDGQLPDRTQERSDLL
jgi:hypothetical protein